VNPVLAHWQVQASGGTYLVGPDGCRDLIRRQVPGEAPVWFVTLLDTGLSRGAAKSGTLYHGWRLQPGTCIDAGSLVAQAARCDDPEVVADLVDAFTTRSAALDEALRALAEAGDVAAAARASGMGLRSFQRCVIGGTGQRPHWWLSLARVRRAALALDRMPLAELADTVDFADQAHLTRMFRRFHGVTPGQMRAGLGPQIVRGYAA
jgi:AraC-like DNA-binding protein